METILFLDNNNSNIKKIENTLKDSYNIIISCDYKNALTQLSSKNIYAIIININIDNGIKIFERINSKFNNIPIIALSNNYDEIIASRLIYTGVQDYITINEINSKFLLRIILCSVERKILEIERKKIIKENLKNQNFKLIAKIAGGIAHNFNNILAGILGNAELLKFNSTNNRLNCDYINNIIYSTEKASLITKHFLAFAKGGKYNNNNNIDIQELIDNIIETISDNKIKIIKEFNSINNKTYGDEEQLKIALKNIAINAKESMPNGGKIIIRTENTKINSKFNKIKNNYIKISIEDNGNGIKNNIKKKVFEPFFTTKDVGKFVGLGLSAAYGIIENHNGILDFETNDKGTKFKIFLPANKYKSTKFVNKKIDLHKEKKNIMIIDDEEIIISTSSKILKKYNFNPICFSNGNNAIDYFKKNYYNIDLIILDIIMPEINGIDIMKELIDIDKNVKIIIYTGQNSYILKKDIINKGAKKVIFKPFRISEIIKSINEII